MKESVSSDDISSNSNNKKVWNQISLRADLSLLKLIRNAIKEQNQDTGWATLGGVGTYINKVNPEFDSRHYGYSKLSELIEAIGLFKLTTQKNTLCIACELPKNELEKIRKIIKKT